MRLIKAVKSRERWLFASVVFFLISHLIAYGMGRLHGYSRGFNMGVGYVTAEISQALKNETRPFIMLETFKAYPRADRSMVIKEVK